MIMILVNDPCLAQGAPGWCDLQNRDENDSGLVQGGFIGSNDISGRRDLQNGHEMILVYDTRCTGLVQFARWR